MSRHNKATALQKLCEDLAGKGLIDLLMVEGQSHLGARRQRAGL